MASAKVLAVERGKIGMTLGDLANTLGVSEEQLQKWENDPRRMPASALMRVADLFACTTDYLLGVSPSRRS